MKVGHIGINHRGKYYLPEKVLRQHYKYSSKFTWVTCN